MPNLRRKVSHPKLMPEREKGRGVSYKGEKMRARVRYSTWFRLYVEHGNELSRSDRKQFRRRFCLPFEDWKLLVEKCKRNTKFERWTKSDAAKVMCSPIQLLVLGSLRYLGRGWTFDDIAEATQIDEEVHRTFLHAFIDFGKYRTLRRLCEIAINSGRYC